MRIVITGGGGFLGSYIAEEASKKKYEVIVIDKYIGTKVNNNIKYIKADMGNTKILKKIIKVNDIVFHLAAISDIDKASSNGIKTVNNNILSTVKLLEVCKQKKIKKFIFSSSIYVHSKIGGFYRISKKSSELFVEEYAKKNKFKFAILRFGTVYGPRQSIKNNISRMIYNAIYNKRLIYNGSKESSRKFIHVNDVAKISIGIISKKFDNKVILIEGNKPTLVSEVLKIIKKKLKLNNKFIFENIKNNHYIKSPYSYFEMKECKYKLNKYIKLEKGIEDLINYQKKSKN
ncbi:NAD(P)-dependent oxidoreductase [Pelagibacteraceae bacterium]|nr:NAD(P)-dependent oxidoreductase [Pelagibacteraceae bacterium]